MKYESEPDIYQGNVTNRFLLGRKGKNPLIVFGVNPSIADDKTPDRTIMKVARFAERYQCDGWIMLNLYPQRSTNPSNLSKELDQGLHQTNLDQIVQTLSAYPNAILCAAWGTPITHRKYLHECLKEIRDVANGDWKSIGPTTKYGHPKHPSRLSYELELQSFDIDQYLCDPRAFTVLAKEPLRGKGDRYIFPFHSVSWYLFPLTPSFGRPRPRTAPVPPPHYGFP